MGLVLGGRRGLILEIIGVLGLELGGGFGLVNLERGFLEFGKVRGLISVLLVEHFFFLFFFI